MTSGNVREPPLIVKVAVVLMNGRTSRRRYTSGACAIAAGDLPFGEGQERLEPNEEQMLLGLLEKELQL